MAGVDHEPAVERLDHFWDGEVTGMTPIGGDVGVDRGLVATLQHLHDLDQQSDDARPPIGLQQRLWRDLAAERGVEARGNSAGVILDWSSGNDRRWNPPPTAMRPTTVPRRWWTAIDRVAAAVLLVAMAGGLTYLSLSSILGPSESLTGGDVSTFRGDSGRSGVMPGPGPSGDPVVRWRFKTGNWEAYSSPAIVDGVVYAGSVDGHLYAIDAAAGIERWRFKTDGRVYASAAVADDIVYVGSSRTDMRAGTLYAIDAATGTERWRFVQPVGGTSDVVVVDGIVFITGGAGGRSFTVNSGGGGGGRSSNVNSAGGDLYALDAATGTERWRFHADSSLSAPVVTAGVVYVTSVDGGVSAIDAATGEPRWQAGLGAPTWNAPVVAGNTVYVGPQPAKGEQSVTILVALDAGNGRERWRFELARLSSWTLGTPPAPSTPAVAEGVVYLATLDGFLYALDAATGTERWRTAVGGFVESAPVVAAGVVYVGSDDGSVYALDAATGAERWRLSLGAGLSAAVTSSPAVVDGVVYVASDDTYLYAIGGTEGATPPP